MWFLPLVYRQTKTIEIGKCKHQSNGKLGQQNNNIGNNSDSINSENYRKLTTKHCALCDSPFNRVLNKRIICKLCQSSVCRKCISKNEPSICKSCQKKE